MDDRAQSGPTWPGLGVIAWTQHRNRWHDVHKQICGMSIYTLPAILPSQSLSLKIEQGRQDIIHQTRDAAFENQRPCWG